jgi:PAS domain S-box-containing protein
VAFDGEIPRMVAVNPAFEEVFGFENDTVIGESIADVLVPESEHAQHLTLRDAVLAGNPTETEVRRRTTDGVRRFNVRIVPIGGSEAPGGAYAWYTDITDQRRYEERLERLNEANRHLLSATTETEVADITVDVVQRVLDQPLAAMWSYSSVDEVLSPLAATDAARAVDGSCETADAFGPIRPGTTEMEVFHKGEITVVEEYRSVDNPAHPETPLGTLLIAPLGEYGQLHVGSESVGAFDATTRDLIEILCQNAEAALERVHRERTLSELNEITRDLFRSSSMEAVATLAVEAGREILGLPFVHIYLTDEQKETMRPAAVTEETTERFGELPQFQRGEGLFWEVLRSGKPRLYDDVQAEADPASDLPFRSAIVVPLGDQGVLASGSIEAAALDTFDRKLASILAATTETALDRAERERRVREQHQDLKAARDRFQSVFDHSNDAIVILDPETDEILEANPKASELLGYPREELRALGPSDIHPDEMERFREFVRAVRSGGSGWTDELYCVTASGRKVPAEISASTLEFDGRESILALIRDVSELRKYERELERQNERLEEVTRVLSHDLRNPMNVASGRVELARKEQESDHLDAVRSSLDRMEEMIEDVLTLARIGGSIEETEPIALDSIVEGCWRNVDTDDAELVTATEMTIEADESRLRHVFENLFRNSIEHGSTSNRPRADDAVEHGSTGSQTGSDDAVEHGGSTVTITVGELDRGFYIEDDGPGIPPETRENVFKKGHSTTETGTGFGLSIVREIVRAHGWEIIVTDSMEGGARFEITGVDGDR